MTVRVVLDTNILLSALLFPKGGLAWLREAWQSGRIVPVVCRETVEELLRVLTYPKFKLTEAEREELLADFLPWAEIAALPVDPLDVPACPDPRDQLFLNLAKSADIDFLVSGEADLLVLADGFDPPIVTGDGLAGRLG